jgi:hypothetical protein
VCTSCRWLIEEDEKLRAALAQQHDNSEGGVYDWRAVAAIAGTNIHNGLDVGKEHYILI